MSYDPYDNEYSEYHEDIVKHTMGPWRLGADCETVCTNYLDSQGSMREVNWTRGGWAKAVCKINHAAWMKNGEAEMNALLIASAPDLLQAAQCALGHLTGNMDGNMYLGNPIEMLREAINKAKGEK